MTSTPISELVIAYDPGTLTERVERRRRLVRSRIVSLVITIVLMVAIYLWLGDRLQGAGFFTVYGLVFAVSIAWVVGSVIAYRRARGQLAALGTGRAIRIGPPGIEVAGLAAPWSAVSSIATAIPGRGRRPVLRLLLADGRRSDLPLDQVVVYPATLDGTVRAFSGGRFGVDLSALDN